MKSENPRSLQRISEHAGRGTDAGRLAGLPQDDEFVLALIAEAAPHAHAMAGRLDRDYAFSDEI